VLQNEYKMYKIQIQIHSRRRRRRRRRRHHPFLRTAPTYALAATTSGNRIHASVAHSTLGIG